MITKLIATLFLIAACSYAIGQGLSDNRRTDKAPIRIATGITEAGRTAWKRHKNKNQGIRVNVDTSDHGFTKTPNYVISIHGAGNQWNLLGDAGVYNPTPKGFEVYLRWTNDEELTPAFANQVEWRVAWVAVEE